MVSVLGRLMQKEFGRKRYREYCAKLKEKEFTSQAVSPPIVLSLDAHEQEMLETYLPEIKKFGYEIENFGGREYMISAIPDNLYHIDMKDLFIEMLDDFSNLTGSHPSTIPVHSQ